MDKGQIVKYVAIAAGVYLVYRFVQGQGWLSPTIATTGPTQVPAPVGNSGNVGTGTQPPATPVTTTYVAAPPASPALSLVDKVRNKARAAGQTGSLNFDQWNYYYSQVMGIPGPAYEDVYTWDQGGGSRGVTMTADQWGEAVARVGLNGLGVNVSGWYGFDAVNLWRT